MSKELMSLEKFKYIMETIEEGIKQRDRISTFMEKELCTDSWCLFNVGTPMENCLIGLLADEFKCWYSLKEEKPKFEWWNSTNSIENNIENYFYSLQEKPYTLVMNNKKFIIDTIEDLYNFLVAQYIEIHKEKSTDNNSETPKAAQKEPIEVSLEEILGGMI